MAEAIRKIGWLGVAAGLSVALSACAGSPPTRPEARAAAPPSTPSPEVAAPPASRAPAASGAFPSARMHLLDAVGSWSGVGARVWTIPDPVRNDEPYRVRFRAECRCHAYLFAVDGDAEVISLLYPNPMESTALLAPGETVEIPTSGGYTLRAVGGEGMDVLKLFVLDTPASFPKNRSDFWKATPAEADSADELLDFLTELDGGRWATAATPLQIVE